MKRKRLIVFLYDLVGLIYSIIISCSAFYLLPQYFKNPLTSLSQSEYVIFQYSIFFSIGYCLISFLIYLFLESMPNRILNNIIRQISIITIFIITSLTEKFFVIIGLLYFMKISSIFFYIRCILWDLRIKGKIVVIMDILFILSFVVFRFIMNCYILYRMTNSYSEYSHDNMFVPIMMIVIFAFVMNLLKLKRMHENIKKKNNYEIST